MLRIQGPQTPPLISAEANKTLRSHSSDFKNEHDKYLRYIKSTDKLKFQWISVEGLAFENNAGF